MSPFPVLKFAMRTTAVLLSAVLLSAVLVLARVQAELQPVPRTVVSARPRGGRGTAVAPFKGGGAVSELAEARDGALDGDARGQLGWEQHGRSRRGG